MANKEQVDFIRKEAKRGKSANQIQRDLRAHHMGMRRQKLLEYVRKFKGKSAKVESQRYTPIKYRKHVFVASRKMIAVYGSVNWQSRRVQMYGSGHDLYEAMMLVSKYPPSKRFLTASAGNIASYPDEYLDIDERWDEHPRAESR